MTVLRILRDAPSPYNPAPLLITYEEAAQTLGGPKKPVSTRHIERLVKARQLRAVGTGRARRIVYASILAYIERESYG